MRVSVCTQDYEKQYLNAHKGFVSVDYTVSIPEVIKFLTDDNPNWERTCYEFPQMKQVTQAEVKIS
jgi:hypothetical protein